MSTGEGISPVETTFFGFKASSSSEMTGIDERSIWV
jgi:hypothetical protein